MNKLGFIIKELLIMVRENKTYILAPIFIVLALLSLLVFYVGPTAVVTFIYAGV